jgi:hypothetical protein
MLLNSQDCFRLEIPFVMELGPAGKHAKDYDYRILRMCDG